MTEEYQTQNFWNENKAQKPTQLSTNTSSNLSGSVILSATRC